VREALRDDHFRAAVRAVGIRDAMALKIEVIDSGGPAVRIRGEESIVDRVEAHLYPDRDPDRQAGGPADQTASASSSTIPSSSSAGTGSGSSV
jgi:hypothetical protein